MVKKGISILLMLSCLSDIKAQDIHFTQYFFSQLNLNPAYTGVFEGNYRIIGNHRSQWGAFINDQFITSGISYDQQIELFAQQFAAGINYVHDQSSIGQLLQNKIELNGSYRKNIKGHLFSGGVQFGLIHKGVDYNEFTYPNQYNESPSAGYFDNVNFDNQQNIDKRNIYYFDLNLGLFWRKQMTKKMMPEIGIALMHINTPNESFFGNVENNLPLRKTLDVSATYLYSKKIKIIPKVLFTSHANAQELVWGGLTRYSITPNKLKLRDVFAGFLSRNGFNRNYDSFNLLVGGTVKTFQIAISYDINTSALSSLSHYRGAFEISLIYKNKKTKSNRINVPCERI